MFAVFNIGILLLIIFSIKMSLSHESVTPFIWYVIAAWTVFCFFVDRVLLKKKKQTDIPTNKP